MHNVAARRIGRREFLSIGCVGVGAVTISPFFTNNALGATAANPISGKSVIFVFQQGGPSQFETFDPKMNAPVETRTVTGNTQTSLPGVIFGDTMQQLAKLAHKFTVVRSFQTGNAGHNILPMVGPDSLDANIGSLYSRVIGPTHPQTGMPTNAVLFPQAVSDDVTKGNARGDLAATGSLGPAYAPVIPGGADDFQKSLRLNMAPDRLGDRRALLEQLEQTHRLFEADEQPRNLDDLQKQAYQVLTSGRVADAMDLSREDAKTLANYDTSRFVSRDGWSKVNRGKKGYYSGHAKTFGKLLLLARRLCEAGCGFVIVHADYEGVWDMHADGNNLNMVDGMQAVGKSFDHAVAAFINDLEDRGLSDKIMLMATGEMGRTPKINKTGGRDHWAKLAPLLIYGGGTHGGQVIGRSTPDGGEPATTAYGPKQMISTILHTVFDMGQLRVMPNFGKVAKLGEIAPIPGLF